MSGLSDLLQHLNTEDWSTRRIEKEAAKHGHKLSNATAARYLNGNHPAKPNHETLQAFADLFGTDVERLREAAGLPGGGTPFELGTDYSRLNGPQREAIRTVARLYLEQNDELAHQPQPDGATETESRVRAYLEQHLLTDERWPDFPLLPRDKREQALDIFVRHGAELIKSGLWSEQLALPTVVEQAIALIRRSEKRARDGATSGATTTNLDRSGADDRPWQQDEYGLAAKRGRNRGREARKQQDREAEDGGA